MSNNPGRNNIPVNGLPFFVARFNDRKATIRRNPDYTKTISSLRSVFEELESVPDKRIRICATFPEFDGEIQVTEDLWEDLLPSLTQVTVFAPKIETPASPVTMLQNILAAPNRETTQVPSRTSMSRIVSPINVLTLTSYPYQWASVVIQSIPVAQQRLIFCGKQLDNESTVHACRISKGSIIHLILRLPEVPY
ncbi:ubiquitin family protein [Ceratobasidium sp. AG-Ba]|nr:ubiquitin family protein [Ceratobasidium sp. AG-Ba]